jgi:GT2 family glycosyltransferase
MATGPRGGIDVVVVTADTRELVLECLERLRDPAVARVIVVDNAGHDGTPAAIEALYPEVVCVRLEEQVGFASACNRGAERGQSEMILFLNSDVMALEGSVSALGRALEADPSAVAVGGRLVDPGTLVPQGRYEPKRFPSVATFTVRLSGLEQLWPGNPWTRREAIDVDVHATSSVEQLAGACMLVRRAAFAKLGGFDESYWFWYEDVDLARRLADCGPLLYVPSAKFEHVGGASFARWSRAEQVRSLVHGMLRYAQAHFGPRERHAFACFLLVLSAPRAILFAPFDRRLAETHRAICCAALRLARGRRVGCLV